MAGLRHRLVAWQFLPLAALIVGAVGCGTSVSYVHFRPSGAYESTGPDWVAKVVYDVPPGVRGVQVELAARGRTATNERGVQYDTLNVRLHVANRGQSAFSLSPADVKLLDDEGGQVAGAEAYAGRNRTGSITIAGGTTATYELVFDLPAGLRLREVGSVRLAWPYTCGGTRYEETTKFLRIEEVNYYYRSDYYRNDYCDPWYDPWYGPRYGPWSRGRFGFGYYHGW